MNNFIQYLLIIIMVHFILKRVLLDLEGLKKNQEKLNTSQEDRVAENFRSSDESDDECDNETFNAEYFNNLKFK